MLLSLSVLLLIGQAAGATITEEDPAFVDVTFGFRIDLPERWRTKERGDSGHAHVLTLLPPGSGGQIAVTVIVKEVGTSVDTAGVVELERTRLEKSSDDVSGFECLDAELGGLPAAELRFDLTQAGVTYRIRQVLRVQEGRLFTVRRHAPVERFEEEDRRLRPIAESFHFGTSPKKKTPERRIPDIASRCGSEVDWEESQVAALERSRATGRPVLIVAWLRYSLETPMTPRSTAFMNLDVLRLVDTRFVPLWVTDWRDLDLRRPDGSAYGLSESALGQALIIVDASGVVRAETNVASSSDVAYPFLCAALQGEPAKSDANVSPISRADALVDRGELAHALDQIAEIEGPAAARVRARALRLEGRLEEALAALEAVRQGGSEGGGDELELERIELLLRLGTEEDAWDAALRLAHAQDTRKDLVARALVDAGAAAESLGDDTAARATWMRVIDEHECSRWAPLAATSIWELDRRLGLFHDLVRPDPADLAEVLHRPVAAPLPVDRQREAAAGALAWLLSHQRDDGSFPDPSAVSYSESLGANPVVDATTSLAGRALCVALETGRAESNALQDGVRRALHYIETSISSRKILEPRVFLVDDLTWSDAAMIEFLAEVADSGLVPRRELAPIVAVLIADLATRQQENGGWSYIEVDEPAVDDVPPQSISFTTAAVQLALSHAASSGFSVPEDLSARATRALEALRDENGVFAYVLWGPGQAPHATISDPSGDVGRGPACELALLRAGASDPDRLARAVDTFLASSPLYTAERGKSLMHAGPAGQGCHYLVFDSTHAALAAAELPPDPERRARILALVLDGREADGSFLDTPITGHTYGTAMALLALLALAEDQEPAAASGSSRE